MWRVFLNLFLKGVFRKKIDPHSKGEAVKKRLVFFKKKRVAPAPTPFWRM